jgi:integrating conjugative element protein (TIGR03756 family)
MTGCSVLVSTKVAHYNPDLVVGIYNELGANPWREARALLGGAQKAAVGGLLGRLLGIPPDSAGNFTEGPAEGNRGHQNTVYREADALGHPLALDALATLGFGYVCPAAATAPLVPYFQSALDALAWRTEIPEALFPASWVPGLREVGTWPLQTWGGVYPRTGWSTQAEEPKAAALAAQRAGDIVTRLAQPHVYLPVTTGFTDTVVPADAIETFAGGAGGTGGVRTVNRMRTWLPPPLIENEPATGTWQMLMPAPEAACAVFGENDLASLTGWGGGRVSAGGDYAWNLWRPYRCCRVRGQYLFSIETAYP